MSLTAENCYSKEVKGDRQTGLKRGVARTRARMAEGCCGGRDGTLGRRGDGLVATRGTPGPAGPRRSHPSVPACPFPARFYLAGRVCLRRFQTLEMF